VYGTTTQVGDENKLALSTRSRTQRNVKDNVVYNENLKMQ